MIKENEELIEKYHLFLREKYTSSVYTYLQGVRELAKYYNKPLLKLTKKELINWKDSIKNQNTKRGYVYSVNKFFKKHKRKNLKLPLPHIKRAIRKPFTSEETKLFIKTSEQDPSENLITLLLYDSICRPNVIKDIKISNIEYKTNIIWLDNRKSNPELSLLISPRLEKAIKNYLLVRPKPINKEDEDILIINKIYKKKYTTTHPFRRITRKIALRAGIQKDVTPYKVIKPSAITNRFEEKVNPRTIQR